MVNMDRNRDIMAKIIEAIGDTQAYQESVIRDEVDDWLDDHPEATTTVEDGAITFAKLNSEVANQLGGIMANNELINLVHGFVNYKYDFAYSAATDAHPVSITRQLQRFILNGTSTNATSYYKISGVISKTRSTSTVDGWTGGLTLNTGHTYIVDVQLISGTISNSENVPSVSVYKAGTHTSVGTEERIGTTRFVRTFVAEEDATYNLAFYVPSSKVFSNAVVMVTLEDKGVVTPPEENVQNRIEETEEPAAEEPAAEEPAAEEPAAEEPAAEEPKEGGEENA